MMMMMMMMIIIIIIIIIENKDTKTGKASYSLFIADLIKLYDRRQ
jgi:hypothetical protein